MHESFAIGWVLDGMVEGEEGNSAELVVAAECAVQGVLVAPVIKIELSIFTAVGFDLVGRFIDGDGHPKIVIVFMQQTQDLLELQVGKDFGLVSQRCFCLFDW